MTWVHDIDGNLDIFASWNKGIKNQRLEKAIKSQLIDFVSLASTPIHDRLMFKSTNMLTHHYTH
jgi:4-aminobutyrate aminotransferase-like enzyme